MDGQRPMEELSDTPNLSRVLEFRKPGEGDQVFVVEQITGPTTTTTIVKVIDEENEQSVRLCSLMLSLPPASLLTVTRIQIVEESSQRKSGTNCWQR